MINLAPRSHSVAAEDLDSRLENDCIHNRTQVSFDHVVWGTRTTYQHISRHSYIVNCARDCNPKRNELNAFFVFFQADLAEM